MLVHSRLSLQVKLVTTTLVSVRGGAVTPGGVPINPAMIKCIRLSIKNDNYLDNIQVVNIRANISKVFT